jgi:hypothetical protein|tara:strand:- start:302 stop:682 length:381 start_codon:yes stop_codon:yes gene_type:complete
MEQGAPTVHIARRTHGSSAQQHAQRVGARRCGGEVCGVFQEGVGEVDGGSSGEEHCERLDPAVSCREHQRRLLAVVAAREAVRRRASNEQRGCECQAVRGDDGAKQRARLVKELVLWRLSELGAVE